MARIFTITEGIENMGALKTGGQGSIYKARRSGHIITAVKLLPTPIYSEEPDDKNFLDFQNEVKKLQKVNEVPNPNVVRILSSGITETGSLPFIEMEYIEGPDLEELLKPPHHKIFTIKETIRLAEQLSNALAHCHRVYVKHGDIKPNNVKLNLHTGNYVLLDFGLAIMSDEQRRTSLRHAGAIEFMAPEQNEGQMLFETDVYSFGVVLFELLAGRVPFPLHDSGETARNRVMVSHMETAPPDLMTLRQENIPETWTAETKDREMHVPDWLIKTVYRCLEKKPANRFPDGVALNDYIHSSSVRIENKKEWANEELQRLQARVKDLETENRLLQQRLETSKTSPDTSFNVVPVPETKSNRKTSYRYIYLLILFVTIAIAAVAYNFMRNRIRVPVTSSADRDAAPQEAALRSIGQFKVIAPRAYFHNEPSANTRRSAYLIPSNDVITAYRDREGFVYTEFTNSRAQVSKGWILKKDLLSLEEWAKREASENEPPSPPKVDINLQLQEARQLLENDEIQAAVHIYSFLAELDVPEAMFEYGNLGLKKQVEELECNEAFSLVKKASDMGYAPAKRTLGFLFIFADNKEVLQINDYEQCTYTRNVFRGSRLILEAVTKGDSTARKLMEELNIDPAAFENSILTEQ